LQPVRRAQRAAYLGAPSVRAVRRLAGRLLRMLFVFAGAAGIGLALVLPLAP
jgi:hypothetical protein